MSPSSRASKSQTSTVQTVLPMGDRQKFADRQLREVAEAVSAGGGIAAGVADLAGAAETVGRSKPSRAVCKKRVAHNAQPFSL